MVDQANSADGAASTREAATNLGREYLETIRADAYTAVTQTLLNNEIAGMPGYAAGPPVTVTRRQVPFEISATLAVIDDPKDGLAASGDNQPDDLKKITVTIRWGGRRKGQLSMSTMLSSSGAKVGIKVSSLAKSPASQTIDQTTPGSTTTFTATATGVMKIIFAVDGTDQASTAVTPAGNCAPTGTCTKTFTWDFSALSDGVYRITARTVDWAGVEGPPYPMNVTISKNQVSPPCAVGSTGPNPPACVLPEAGYNYLPGTSTPVFEIRWQANPQRNVVGYVVEDSGGTQICKVDAQGNVTFLDGQLASLKPGVDSYGCIDDNPPA